MMPGDPWDPKSFMGAIVDKTQLDKLMVMSNKEKRRSKNCDGWKNYVEKYWWLLL